MAVNVEEVFAARVKSLCSMSHLTWIVDREMDTDILARPFRGYASLWEWTLQQKRGDEVASHFLENRNSLVPINAVNGITGDSVVTNSRTRLLRRPDLLKKLLCSGENLDFINRLTGDTFLHALAKQLIPDGSLHLLKNLINEFENPKWDAFALEEVNIPNPDHKNVDGKTALDICLERNQLKLGGLLVSKLGANWKALSSEQFSSNKTVLDLLKKWEKAYGLSSNNIHSEVGDVCKVCTEALNVPEEIYWMECCGNLIHVDCFRTYLARSKRPHCMFCNMLVVKEVRRKIPKTICNFDWVSFITNEAIEEAATAIARTTQNRMRLRESNLPPL